MGSRSELLEELALRYLTIGSKLGFSPNEIVQAVSNLSSSKFQEKEVMKKRDSEEEQYYNLFEESLIKNTKLKDFPKKEILRKGLVVMYVVHQKRYTDVQSFGELASDKLGPKAGTNLIIGTNPYAGLAYIIRQEMHYSDWTIMKRPERLNQLERIEKIWYAKFKEEFENRTGLK